MFYRIADHKGKGPYRGPRQGSDLWDKEGIFDRPNLLPRHPRPRDDALMGPEWDRLYQAEMSDLYVFGFLNLDQLREWFFTEDARNGLHTHGFRVYVFENHGHLIIGETQAAAIITWPLYSYSLSLLEI
jgi:hypothetical protein